MVTWELRYRLKMIDNVLIETFTDQEAEAKALADLYLASLGSPAVRFVRLRPILVAHSGDHPAMVAKWGAGAARPTPAATPSEDEEPDRVPPMSGTLTDPPPASATADTSDDDAIDDQMSGPPVATPRRRSR